MQPSAKRPNDRHVQAFLNTGTPDDVKAWAKEMAKQAGSKLG